MTQRTTRNLHTAT